MASIDSSGGVRLNYNTPNAGRAESPKETSGTGKGNFDGKAKSLPDVKDGAPSGGAAGVDPTSGMSEDERAQFEADVAAAAANWGSVVTDDPTALFATLVQVQAAINKQNRDDMLKEGEAAKNAALEAANKTKKAGEELKSGALKAMVFSLVASAVGTVMAGVSFKGTFTAAKALKSGMAASKGVAETTKQSSARAADFAAKQKTLSGAALKAEGRQYSADQAALKAQKADFQVKADASNNSFTLSNSRVSANQQLGGALSGVGTSVAGYMSASAQGESQIIQADGQAFTAAAETYRMNQNLRQDTAKTAQTMMETLIESMKQKAQNETDRMAANTKV